MTIARRSFLTSALAASVLPSLASAADRIPLGDVSRYLNALSTLKARFTQISDDGSIATGTLFIHRPGRVRFEYDPPVPALVMAGGGQVAVFDAKSNQPPERYPLRRTPLNLILRQRVNLGADNMVIGHDSDGTTTSVTAQDPENPELGTIRLIFTGPPVELRQWVIRSADASETTVILGELEQGGSFRPSLFSIPTELQKRGLN